MKHVLEFNDGSSREFHDGAIRLYDVQLTPLGVRVISKHLVSADEQVSMLFPWQAVRMYSMTGDPAKMVKVTPEGGVNGS